MKVYYNQSKISTSFINFFKSLSHLSLPHLKNLSFILSGLISAESVVSSDIARKLKDDFSLVDIESIERRFRRFFFSFSPFAYSFYDSLIRFIVSNFSVKHSDNNIHISFDHMFCKDKFTISLFSLRIGKQGIPIWFRCFKGKDNPEAFKTDLIKQGISYCANLFLERNYHIIFLADRWFPNVDILSHIQSIGGFFCLRAKSSFVFSHYDSRGFLITEHIGNIKPHVHDSRIFKNIFYTNSNFVTNLVVSRASCTDDPWYIVTNDNTSRAIRNYSYRFGSIECIFKSQKSNGFRLESTNTKKIEHFISLFTITCIAIVWLTIIGADYSKNKRGYKIHIRDSRKTKSNHNVRVISLFNLGLTIFNLCYYNSVDFNLKFNFVLYDI